MTGKTEPFGTIALDRDEDLWLLFEIMLGEKPSSFEMAHSDDKNTCDFWWRDSCNDVKEIEFSLDPTWLGVDGGIKESMRISFESSHITLSGDSYWNLSIDGGDGSSTSFSNLDSFWNFLEQVAAIKMARGIDADTPAAAGSRPVRRF